MTLCSSAPSKQSRESVRDIAPPQPIPRPCTKLPIKNHEY
ncbi:Uncharacterised protein [Vibrio cholerae]|nr:Uncharacterised protein [Vibrio cholerae]CSI74793.1 Uncharacterised protein [Vibrio cholerae]